MLQTSENLAWLIVLPLFSSAILLLIGKRANSWGHVMACIVSASTFTIGIVEFFAMQSRSAENRVPAIVLLGAQWGDEGKGKASDILGDKVKYVKTLRRSKSCDI